MVNDHTTRVEAASQTNFSSRTFSTRRPDDTAAASAAEPSTAVADARPASAMACRPSTRISAAASRPAFAAKSALAAHFAVAGAALHAAWPALAGMLAAVVATRLASDEPSAVGRSAAARWTSTSVEATDSHGAGSCLLASARAAYEVE